MLSVLMSIAVVFMGVAVTFALVWLAYRSERSDRRRLLRLDAALRGFSRGAVVGAGFLDNAQMLSRATRELNRLLRDRGLYRPMTRGSELDRLEAGIARLREFTARRALSEPA